MLDITHSFLYLFLLIIKGILYLALYGVLLWVAWELVQIPKDKPRPNRRKLDIVAALVLVGLAQSGWTWPEEPGAVQLRGAAGFTAINYLTDVKGAGPTDPYSFSDLRMANGPAFMAGVQYYVKPWVSVGIDAILQRFPDTAQAEEAARILADLSDRPSSAGRLP